MLSQGSNELPKRMFVITFLKTTPKRNADTWREAKTNAGTTNTPVPPNLLPGAHRRIAIVPELDFLYEHAIAIHPHRCELLRV